MDSLFDINAHPEGWFSPEIEPAGWFDEQIKDEPASSGNYGSNPCCGAFGRCLRGKL